MAGGHSVSSRSLYPAGGAEGESWARNVKWKTEKLSGHDISVLTHGLQHVQNVPCEDTVKYMSGGVGAGGFLSVHHNGCVRFYHPDGRLRNSSITLKLSVPYEGLISTNLPDRLVGWGPGNTLTLLDSQLTPLTHARDTLDIRVCQVIEGSEEFVTAGAAPAADKGLRVLAVSDRTVSVLDLRQGCVLEHKTNLHLRKITGVVYCQLQESVVTASKDMTIKVWGPDWDLLMSFVGHTAVVNALLLCPVSGLLLSSSLDRTLRCWNLQTGDQVQTVSIAVGTDPPLTVGGPSALGTFFSFSRTSVDFWTFSNIYELHCRLDGDVYGPVRQILAPPTQLHYPSRIVCVHGKSEVTLVAAETGAVLTTFRAKGQVRCVDYCLCKEILLVLSEEGTVIRASTLTSPMTLLDERQPDWWSGKEKVDIGLACCMALYSDVAEPQRALDEWRSLQQQKEFKMRSRTLLDSDNNRFLIVLGHCGGHISVMEMHSGKVQYTSSAHSGQNVCSIQAYPNNSCILTAGEDNAVLLWRVFPHAQECLSVHISVLCAHTPVCVALLGSLLTTGLQQPQSATYSLVQYDLTTQSRMDHPPEHDHSSTITGFCMCQKLRVFASCSQDGTVRIWDEENRLLRTLELNAEPECVEFNGDRGELLLGIKGDLYRIHYTHILPPDLQLQFLYNEDLSDPVPDPLFSCRLIHKQRSVSSPVSEVEGPEKQGDLKDPEFKCLLVRNTDLRSLQSGETHNKMKTTAYTPQARREAFNRYIKLLYKEPVHINIPDDDPFDLDTVLFQPKPPEQRNITPPIQDGIFPNRSLGKKLDRTQETSPVPSHQSLLGFVPNSVLVQQLWPDMVVEDTVSPKPLKLRDDLSHKTEENEEEELQLFFYEDEDEEEYNMLSFKRAKTPSKPPERQSPSPTPLPSEKASRPLPPIKHAPPPKPLSPPKPPTPSLTPPRQATPPAPHISSPKLPIFLQQFLGEQWFHSMHPDKRCISESLNPAEFCRHLLDFLKICAVDHKLSVLSAIITLNRQNLINDTQLFTHHLLTSLHSCLHKNMSDDEHRFVEELLKFLVCVNSHSYELAVELLSLLANKQLKLQGLAVCMLQVLGVDDVQQWLRPQLESWDSRAQKQPNPMEKLREAAGQWLHVWTDQYRVHKQKLPPISGGDSVISPVEVLHFFCSLQKNGQVQPNKSPLEGRKDTVLLDTRAYRWRAVQRLGETYSMSRVHEPRGIWLPPLVSRPLLMGFTRLLSFPLAHITLSPFPLSLDAHCLKEDSPRRYFLLEQSYVQYYR
ncbi:WD repeat-containing protein 97 isoform X2 [Hoplias malabaricus]|uniref:WD repeat-containing protein 97 isoform X2 n=1 Tax=Hoplias malabaricus TaxID=27720 RepID=UPI0034629920